jgi:predicted nucleic acid-binding protein
MRIQDRYRLSWYDSLIVSAAQHGGCKILYSEDLQHGQQFGAVTVKNPFL